MNKNYALIKEAGFHLRYSIRTKIFLLNNSIDDKKKSPEYGYRTNYRRWKLQGNYLQEPH